MEENTETLSKQENPKSGNIFSIFSNFKFQLPFLNPKQAPKVVAKDDARETRVDDEENRSQKPDVVTFPRAQLTVPTPVAVENEEPGKTSNPIILWQVYALGGFLVLRWIWARWNERKAQNDSSNDDPSDDQPAAD